MHQLPSWLGPLIVVGLLVSAAVGGRWEERFGVGGLALDVLLTRILRDQSWPHVQWAGFGADFAFMALLFVLALRSRKFWPMPAAAFQFLATLTHIAKLVDPHVGQWAYLSAIVIWSYALAITLAVGIWNSWRQRVYAVNAGPHAPTADTRR